MNDNNLPPEFAEMEKRAEQMMEDFMKQFGGGGKEKLLSHKTHREQIFPSLILQFIQKCNRKIM